MVSDNSALETKLHRVRGPVMRSLKLSWGLKATVGSACVAEISA